MIATGQMDDGAEPPSGQQGRPDAWDDLPIEALDLNIRTYNALRRANIRTIGQLLSMPSAAFEQVPHWGERNYKALRAALIEHGIPLPEALRAPFAVE